MPILRRCAWTAAALACAAAAGAQRARPAPCAGERAALLAQARAEAIRRVERAYDVAAGRTAGTFALPDGSSMDHPMEYTAVMEAMIFGECPYSSGQVSELTTCVAGHGREWRDQRVGQVERVLLLARSAVRSAPVLCAPADEDCAPQTAYSRATVRRQRGEDPHSAPDPAEIRDPRTIYLCAGAFQAGTVPALEVLTRNLIHESAHLAGIHHEAPSGEPVESYCGTFDCDSRCAPPDMADGWAHLVNCLSGAPRDSAMRIQGSASGAPAAGGGAGGP